MKKDEFREKVFLLDFMNGYQDQERSAKGSITSSYLMSPARVLIDLDSEEPNAKRNNDQQS